MACRRNNRVVDIYAGRVFAQAIARELKGSPDFQRDFAEVKSELESRHFGLPIGTNAIRN
jgi:hypothetical protein